MKCFDQLIWSVNNQIHDRSDRRAGRCSPFAPQQGIAFFAAFYYFKAHPREGGHAMALKKQGSAKRVERGSPVIKPLGSSPQQGQIDTRRVYYAHEMPEELRAVFEKEFEGEPTPHLDHLLK